MKSMSVLFQFIFAVFGISLVNSAQIAHAQTPSAAPKTIVSVLTLTSKLDHKLIESFEMGRNVSVRVDFVGSAAEIEGRIRTTPRAWDLVLADERHLRALALARLIKVAPAGKVDSTLKYPLEKRSRLNDEGRLYFPLMADPLGLVWIRETKQSKDPVSWQWLSNPTHNPLWRGRTALTPALNFQFLMALSASGIPLSQIHSVHETRTAMEWLKEARANSASAEGRLDLNLLSRRVVASNAWLSEFTRLNKYVPNLEFGVPAQGTFYERYGMALLADAPVDGEAMEFLAYAVQKKDELARVAGLVPLSASEFLKTETAGWLLFEDEVPLPSQVEAELKKFAELK